MPIDAFAAPLRVVGVGGHGRVVADALLAAHSECEVQGYDDAPSWQGRDWFGGRLCLGAAADARRDLPAQGFLHIAVGINAIRQRLAEQLQLDESCWASVVHPRAVVSAHARVQAGSFVAANAVLAPQAQLGRGVIVNHAAVVDHDVVLGDFCHVAPGAVLGGGSALGARVLLGAGAVVLPGVRICDDAVIGAGAVVVRDVLTPGVWRGVPAQEH